MKQQKQQLSKRVVSSCSIIKLFGGALLLLFLLGGCTPVNHIAKVEVSHTAMGEMEEDDNINAMIAPYKSSLDEEMDVVIGYCKEELTKGKPESTLGNWVSDLLVERSSYYTDEAVDFAVQNYGGLRISSVSAGPITVGKIYELMPFDNLIVILKMRGDSLMRFFDHMAYSNGWPISHQVRYVIENGKATNVTIHGQPVVPTQLYSVALPDYIANGGNHCEFLANAEGRIDMEYLVRDAIIDQVKLLSNEERQVEAILDNRVSQASN